MIKCGYLYLNSWARQDLSSFTTVVYNDQRHKTLQADFTDVTLVSEDTYRRPDPDDPEEHDDPDDHDDHDDH